jgi:hypothetical protein
MLHPSPPGALWIRLWAGFQKGAMAMEYFGTNPDTERPAQPLTSDKAHARWFAFIYREQRAGMSLSTAIGVALNAGIWDCIQAIDNDKSCYADRL